jgi:hypothetical protein
VRTHQRTGFVDHGELVNVVTDVRHNPSLPLDLDMRTTTAPLRPLSPISRPLRCVAAR